MKITRLLLRTSVFILLSHPLIVSAQSITAPNNKGIITQNQNGNNLLYIAPQRLRFTPELGSELLQKLQGEKEIVLQTIGGNADQIVGNDFQNFLESNGFKVQRQTIGVLAPPPDGKLTLRKSQGGFLLIVAPSA